jgi:hypothetical protein
MSTTEVNGRRYNLEDLDFNGTPYGDAIPESDGVTYWSSSYSPYSDTINMSEVRITGEPLLYPRYKNRVVINTKEVREIMLEIAKTVVGS